MTARDTRAAERQDRRVALDVRFNVYERRFLHLDPADSDLWAELHGISARQYEAILRDIRFESVDAATALVADAEFRDAFRHLAADAQGSTVALGDSITADRGSWLTVLTWLGQLSARPIGWINAGISGDTTTHALARFDLTVAAYRPTRVVILLGTNDCRRSPSVPGGPLVPPADYDANVRRLIDFTLATGAEPVLVTPPPVDERSMSEWTFELDATWRNEDLGRAADIVRSVGSARHVDVVDLWPAFEAAGSDAFLADGLHPSATGHKAIAREVVRVLTAGVPSAGGRGAGR